jgi:putative ABC transport system substrate-binding protein
MEAMVRIVWTSVLLLLSVGVSADVVLLSSSPSKVASSLQALLTERLNTPVQLISNVNQPLYYERYELAIAVGADALKDYSVPKSLPLIAAFVSQTEYQMYSDRLSSAVFVEPPMERQLRLAEAILGEQREYGVLVQKQASADVLRSGVNVYVVEEFETLNHALIKLLAENQALIGVYDPQLYSPNNIKNILITAYRHNRPLIGPSSAYLRAGALATTYSDLNDVAERLSEIALRYKNKGDWIKADFNPYFRVGFNEQVGRSLNLLLPDIDDVTRTLHQREESE